MANNNNMDEKKSNSKKEYKGKGNPKRSKGKGRKPYVKRESGKEESLDKRSNPEADVNNPAYYYENETILNQIMNFSFNQFGGVPFYLKNGSNDGEITSYNPMISGIYLNPSLPVGDSVYSDGVSGTTIASLRNYLMLSGSNAKTTSYAPQDVTLLELALAEILKMSTWCARALGIAYLFNYRNREYPETLLRVMHIDANDFKANLAQYRISFNKLMAVASKIPFPSTIPAFAKAASLYGSLFLDDDNSALAQTYMLNPATVWIYDEAYDDNGAGLITWNWCFGADGAVVTFQDFLNVLEKAINALLNSTALNAIYSDILRLVQNGKISQLISFGTVDENMMIVPTYNQEVEVWLHNAILMGHPLATEDQYNPNGLKLTNANDVSCDANTNAVKYYPQFKMVQNFGSEALIDFDHDTVSVEDRVRCTRFSHRFTLIENTTDNYFYTERLALNDEYIVDICVTRRSSTEEPMRIWQSCNAISTAFAHPMSTSDYTLLVHCITKFDWFPLIYTITTPGADGNPHLRLMGDLDYYTVLSYSDLNKMYDYEILHFLQIQ